MKLSQRTIGLLAAATTVVAAIFWFWPPRTSNGADLLPATTPVFVQVPNVIVTTARWAQTQAAAAVAKLREGATAQGAGGLMTKRWGSLFDAVVRGAVELADGEVFVALTGLQTTPRIAPQLAVGIQIGNHGPQARQWLDQLKRQLKHDFPAADFSDQQYSKTDYQQWRLEPGLDICAALLADRLVLTLCAAPMMEIIDCYHDSSRATLSGSEAFRATRTRLPNHADWLMIVQTEPLMRTLDPFLQWMPQLQALAKPLAQIDAIGAAQVFDGSQVRDALTVVHKVSPSQPCHPFKPALLERMPASCVVGAMADVPATDVYNLGNQMTLALGNSEWMKAQTVFEAAWMAQQADFARDVLGTLGTPVAVALDWPAGQQRLAVLFGAPLRDPDRLTAILQRFDKAGQAPPIRWRIVNGWLWLSFSEESLERVSQTARGSTPALRIGVQGQAALVANSGWLWVFADTARFATVLDNPAAMPPLLAGMARHGRYDEALAVSPLGNIVSAWLAIEAANRQPAVKK